MAFVCGGCRKSLSEPHNVEDTMNIVHTPCGHVFHQTCILAFFEKFVDINKKSYCPNCKVTCDASKLGLVFPVRRENIGDTSSSSGSPNQTQTAQPAQTDSDDVVGRKHFGIAMVLFIFVLACGKRTMEQNIAQFEWGDDELYEAGTFLDSTWALLFLIAGMVSILCDKF